MKKDKKELGEATRAGVREEMAKPRMAKSVREGQASRSAKGTVLVQRGSAKRQLHSIPLPRRAR